MTAAAANNNNNTAANNKNSASNTNTNNNNKMIVSNSKMLQIVRRTSMEVPNNEMSNVPNGVNTVKNESLETLNVANSRKNECANKKHQTKKAQTLSHSQDTLDHEEYCLLTNNCNLNSGVLLQEPLGLKFGKCARNKFATEKKELSWNDNGTCVLFPKSSWHARIPGCEFAMKMWGGGASGSGPVEAKLWPKCLSTFDPPLAVREARLTHLHKGRLGFPQAIISTKEIQAENRPNCLLLTSEIFWKANQSRWKRVLKAADFFAAHKLFRLMFRIRRCLRN